MTLLYHAEQNNHQTEECIKELELGNPLFQLGSFSISISFLGLLLMWCSLTRLPWSFFLCLLFAFHSSSFCCGKKAQPLYCSALCFCPIFFSSFQWFFSFAVIGGVSFSLYNVPSSLIWYMMFWC